MRYIHLSPRLFPGAPGRFVRRLVGRHGGCRRADVEGEGNALRAVRYRPAEEDVINQQLKIAAVDQKVTGHVILFSTDLGQGQ